MPRVYDMTGGDNVRRRAIDVQHGKRGGQKSQQSRTIVYKLGTQTTVSKRAQLMLKHLAKRSNTTWDPTGFGGMPCMDPSGIFRCSRS